jgi:hypothetical protein
MSHKYEYLDKVSIDQHFSEEWSSFIAIACLGLRQGEPSAVSSFLNSINLNLAHFSGTEITAILTNSYIPLRS